MKSKFGITYLEKDIPVKAPDGFFRIRLPETKASKEKITNVARCFGKMQEVWAEIKVESILKVFADWKRRLRLVSVKDGEHIENTKALHKKLYI